MGLMKDLSSKSILAGLLIGFAGVLYLRAVEVFKSFEVSETSDHILTGIGVAVGAVLFSLGLLSVIIFKSNLFTGKVGYINSPKTLLEGLYMLLLNLLSAFALGVVYRFCIGGSAALLSRYAKDWYRILFDSFICGMCVFLSVDLYKRTSKIITVILPVVAFIICGGEHCIAFSFYIGTAPFDQNTPKALLWLLIMIAGNSLGALLLRLLSYCLVDRQKETV